MSDKKAKKLNEEESYESPKLRPLCFDDYVGQENVKKQLKIFIEAAKIKRAPLAHTLFFGPPGLGKTTLAEIMAKELDSNIITTSAPAIEKGGDLAALIMELKKGDILFIDEIHALKKVFEEMLYPAMEDFMIDLTINSGGENKIIHLPIEEFTLIGATTRPGLLSNPFRDRFTIIQGLDYYKKNELVSIIKRSAKLLGLSTTEKAVEEIAVRSRGAARIANNLLKMVGDYAIVKNDSLIDKKIAKEALDDFNIDAMGLDLVDRRMLEAMYFIYNQKPVGIKNIATYIGEDKETVEVMIEPYLIQKGLIARTERGRMLTDAGISYIKKNNN